MNSQKVNHTKGEALFLKGQAEKLLADIECLITFADVLNEDQVNKVIRRIEDKAAEIFSEAQHFSLEQEN